jgi:hypothetical protein
MTYFVRSQNPKNKHNATRTKFQGNLYHSKGEAGYAMAVEAEKGAGEIQSWERQFKIDLKVNGRHITNYYMDFVVHVDANTVELREYKGYATSEWKMKWLILEATLLEVGERYWPGKEVKMILIQHKSNWRPK